MVVYSLLAIRVGTGWTRDQRFVRADDSTLLRALLLSRACMQESQHEDRHFCARVLADVEILVDDQGRWRANLSGADVIDAYGDICPNCQLAGSAPAVVPGTCDATCNSCGADWPTKDTDDYDDEPAYPDCPACGGPTMFLGLLGTRAYFRCQHCGLDCSVDTSDPAN